MGITHGDTHEAQCGSESGKSQWGSDIDATDHVLDAVITDCKVGDGWHESVCGQIGGRHNVTGQLPSSGSVCDQQ